jgi:hypothetical protein
MLILKKVIEGLKLLIEPSNVCEQQFIWFMFFEVEASEIELSVAVVDLLWWNVHICNL